MSDIANYLKRSNAEQGLWELNGVGHLYEAVEETAVSPQPKQRKGRPEHALQEAVRDALLLDGWLVIWMNSGAQKVGNRFVIFNRWKIAHQPENLGGVSDLIAVGHGKTLFLELKSATGKLSGNQRSFWAAVEAAGGTYVVVRSVEDLRPFLKNIEI